MRIIFIRHGEPDYENDCLTETGILQAEAVARRLQREGIREIYSSPNGRAAQTAACTARLLGLPVKQLDYMREITWGGKGIPVKGHPWTLSDWMIRKEDFDFYSEDWREHPYFVNNKVTAEADHVAQKTDEWLLSLGYERHGCYYRCIRQDDRQRTVALFSHGGSSAAAMGHIMNLPFPYACGVFHIHFTGITIIRLDRHPGAERIPCLELVNDAAHIHASLYHRLAEM